MPGQDQRGVRTEEILPQRLQFGVNSVTFEHATAEERVMAVSQNACVGMLGKVLAQLSFFWRASRASTQNF